MRAVFFFKEKDQGSQFWTLLLSGRAGHSYAKNNLEGEKNVNSIRFGFVILASVFTGQCKADDEGPKKIALLVGINAYDNEEIDDLRGCVNDVEAMKKLLLEQFSFKEENIKTLTSKKGDPNDKPDRPTKANIISAFRTHLINREYSDKDIVVFHFAGHGSQMKDQDGDEAFDGRDETIVPCDSRSDGNFDIRDDEINGLFHQLTEQGPNVTFIFDSCHSGSGTRDVGVARSIPADERDPPPIVPWERSERGTSDTDSRFEEKSYVLIAACQAEQKAREILVDGSRQGLLTHFLIKSIRDANKDGVTYDDIMDQVRSHARREVANQEPQLEGKLANNYVFSDESSVANPHILVTRKGDKMELEAGRAQGMTENSVFDVFKLGTKTFDGERVAEIRIEKVNALTSSAVVVTGDIANIKTNSRAIETVHSYETEAFPVLLIRPQDVREGGIDLISGVKDPGQSKPMKKIRDALQNDKKAKEDFRISEEPEDARLLIAHIGNSIKFYLPTLEEIPGATINSNDAGLVTVALDQVGYWAKWHNVLGITGPPTSKLKLAAKFERTDGKATRGLGDTKNLKPLAKLQDGTEIDLFVENTGNEGFFFSVITISTDGSVAVLYPHGEKLLPGKKVVIEIEVYLPTKHEKVMDVQKVIATQVQADYDFLEMSRSKGTRTRGANPSSFLQMLEEAASLRRASRRRVKRDEWNTAEVLYDVVKKPNPAGVQD